MPAKPKRIRKIEYDRIDRVPDGAQPGAHITLVKARKVRISKLVDPASLDAKIQSIRDAFNGLYSDNYGCCSPCSGYVYIDAIYEGFVIACDSKGEYWRFSYTMGGDDQDADDVSFGTPECVDPTVSWSAESDGDATPPVPVMKAQKLWEAEVEERAVRVTKWTDTTDNRKKLAAMDPPQALSDGAYPMPNSTYVTKAIDALGRAGKRRGQVLSLIKRRAKELGMDLSDSSVPELSGSKSKTTKERTMPPTALADLDLSALDDETRLAVEGALAEKGTAPETPAAPAPVAAVTEPEMDEDDDNDLESIEDIQKAIKKARSPEMKRVLKATLTRMQKAEAQAAESHEQMTRLVKAERVRIFKERANAVRHIAAHASTDDDKDGVVALAKMLETIDEKAGSEVVEALEKVLQKAHIQANELMDRKGLLKSVGRSGGEGEGFASVIGTTDDPHATVAELAAEIKKANPELTDAQARTRVLKARPDLYAASIAR